MTATQSPSSKAALWKDQSFTYWESLKALFGVVVLLFIIEAVDQIFFRNRLFAYGVQRGDFGNWHRIFFAPFLHDGWAHVMSNSIGLLLLGSIVLGLGLRVLLTVTFFAIVAAGVGVLFFGKDGVHAGASGVVYGYFAFLVVRGFYEKSWTAILLSVVVLFVFQGMLIGLVPGHRPGISWEGHLFGALGGVSAAGTMARGRKERKSARMEG